MKRRQFIVYAGAGALTTLLLGFDSVKADSAPNDNSLSIKWLGHTCFLFTGGGVGILVNPFHTLGCTTHYRAPKVAADLVLISSQLLDEGATDGLPGSPRLVYTPGVYEFHGIKLQGIGMNHDREGGRRFGMNVAWLWQQQGINILDLGGAAAGITVEQKILMGRPDVLLLPVGGGPKAYNPQEAQKAIQMLNPKLVIPTQYRTQAADDKACDIVHLEEFLTLMNGTPVKQSNSDTVAISPSGLTDNGPVIQLFSYNF